MPTRPKVKNSPPMIAIYINSLLTVLPSHLLHFSLSSSSQTTFLAVAEAHAKLANRLPHSLVSPPESSSTPKAQTLARAVELRRANGPAAACLLQGARALVRRRPQHRHRYGTHARLSAPRLLNFRLLAAVLRFLGFRC